jgi:hypothetical protein
MMAKIFKSGAKCPPPSKMPKTGSGKGGKKYGMK